MYLDQAQGTSEKIWNKRSTVIFTAAVEYLITFSVNCSLTCIPSVVDYIKNKTSFYLFKTSKISTTENFKLIKLH